MAFHAYDGTTWREATSVYVYDGATWQLATQCWVYDGTTWHDVCASCDTVGCTAETDNWLEDACNPNKCDYCMQGDFSNCSDSCHNIDGQYQQNSGSWTNSTGCMDLSCTNDSGTACSAAGAYEFSCDILDCVANGNYWAGRLRAQRDSDSVYECTLTGEQRTGTCVA